MSTWIDFKELRRLLDFEKVLVLYGVEIRRKGEQHQGFCPLPGHEGKKNSPSFSANLKRGIFHCFGCQAQGNLIEFAALMENLNPEVGRDVRKAALLLRERFAPDAGVTRTRNPKSGFRREPPKEPDLPLLQTKSQAVVNAPLDFELKDLDRDHSYLPGRGFTKATIEHFALGYCSRGMLKGRVVIPLRDEEGRLVGYAGRVVDDGTITPENPRYKFPGKRERNGVLHEFQKSRFLYNGHLVPTGSNDIVVVEGFPSVWWLHQNGVSNVVGAMGAACSETQAAQVVSRVKSSGQVWIIPDGNEAGERFAESLLRQITPFRFVRWIKLEEDMQPTDLSKDDLRRLFTV